MRLDDSDYWIDDLGSWNRVELGQLCPFSSDPVVRDRLGLDFAFQRLGMVRVSKRHSAITIQWDIAKVNEDSLTSACSYLWDLPDIQRTKLRYYFGGWLHEIFNGLQDACLRVEDLNSCKTAIPFPGVKPQEKPDSFAPSISRTSPRHKFRLSSPRLLLGPGRNVSSTAGFSVRKDYAKSSSANNQENLASLGILKNYKTTILLPGVKPQEKRDSFAPSISRTSPRHKFRLSSPRLLLGPGRNVSSTAGFSVRKDYATSSSAKNEENSASLGMVPLTLFCESQPIKEAIEQSFAAMRPDEQLEVLWAMQEWKVHGVENNHIYQYVGSRYEVLVRRVKGSRRRIVAVHDKNRNRIEAVNLEAGDVRSLIRPAHLKIGPHGGPTARNQGWTG